MAFLFINGTLLILRALGVAGFFCICSYDYSSGPMIFLVCRAFVARTGVVVPVFPIKFVAVRFSESFIRDDPVSKLNFLHLSCCRTVIIKGLPILFIFNNYLSLLKVICSLSFFIVWVETACFTFYDCSN